MHRTSLAVQQFLCYFSAGGSGSIPHWRTKILCDQKKMYKTKILKKPHSLGFYSLPNVFAYMTLFVFFPQCLKVLPPCQNSPLSL